ncbi:MAG: stage IV sporulation protein A [Bacilli bacterium]|nr:stage IV sporulation protein A [Bacilli bacterium]MDD4076955.1 stage IV sporulation protein A [Bacilli bacterium]MDD4388858.1 stage IV sporulation protein A [Bacilli bacterium]
MSDIIRNVVYRTNGEMYIGVVGSVRSGKSLFIRKFIENKVLPYVTADLKDNIIDDLPQSGEGRTIMTVEPKFVPANTANIVIDKDLKISVRLVDCVGYIIPTAKGYMNEDHTPRLVKTPWFSENIPFEEAATIGTKKVIENHTHIGILMTSDGSFGEFTRPEFEKVEERLVEELKNLDKPFVIVLNTAEANTNKTKALVDDLVNKYEVGVVAVNVANLTNSDIDKILYEALNEFDIAKLDIRIPNWITVLDDRHPVKNEFNTTINDVTGEFRKFKHVQLIREKLAECELFEKVDITSLDSGTGEVEIEISCNDDLYNKIVEEIIGDAINDRGKFIELLQDATLARSEYENYRSALEAVKTTGYGIAIPQIENMTLETPEVIKQGSRYGIKLRALAPSIHMIKVEVDSSFEPIIGSEDQSKKLLDKLLSDYDNNPEQIWESEIFGRKLSEVVNDGIKAKIYLMPENVQYKLRECLEKIVNKGRGGIIAFIL